MLLNYATANNTPFDTIENLFVDSGGYSQLLTGEAYQTSDREYLAYLRTHDPELFALRDYPCSPAVLRTHDRTVRDHQQRTTRHHRRLLDTFDDSGLTGEPVAVLQGWSPAQYLTHLDELRSEGLLTRYVGIGSLARRQNTSTVAQIIHQVRDELPENHRLHGFGVTPRVLQCPRVVTALDSADSTAYELRTRLEDRRNTWREQAYHYLRMKRQLETLTTSRSEQQSLVHFKA
ncbi:deazapurine DNA modification protein DpdA family protein [Natronobacterium texcoconense]|uniref:deazapurine DNA modification protein DpdA family protein n=1 Tax=Natronobacterium texcoconense TaxID=1095778 RepID=UPI0011137D5C|nr:hypothetical protein [Natronobacterium texcoconense]